MFSNCIEISLITHINIYIFFCIQVCAGTETFETEQYDLKLSSD